jgi:hypothetical protein
MAQRTSYARIILQSSKRIFLEANHFLSFEIMQRSNILEKERIKMKIRIVTDSTCDLPEEIVSQQEITVIPLYIAVQKSFFQ